MHNRTGGHGFDVLETTEEFENLFDNVKHYDSDEYVVPEESVSEVAILTYK